MDPLTRKGVLWAFLASATMASFLVPWKLATQIASPPAIVLVMVSMGALINMAIFYLDKKNRHLNLRLHKSEVIMCLSFGLLTLIGNHASALALTFLPPSVLSSLMRTEVIFVAIMGLFFLKEKIEPLFWVGLFIVAAGTFLLSPPHGPSKDFTLGLLCALVSTLSFSSMAILTRKFIHKINPIKVNGVRLFFSIGLWFIIYDSNIIVKDFSADLLLYGTLAAILGPGFSRLFLMYSARHLEARLTSLIILGSPVITLLLSTLLLLEKPHAGQILGSMLMILGIALPLSYKPILLKIRHFKTLRNR